jgi:hypothetical protein
MKRWSLLQISAACLAAAVMPVGAGCSGGGTKSDPPGTIMHGMVLYGNDAAIADPNGADGLVPAGAGVEITAEYIFGGDDTSHVLPSLITDSQGRFTLKLLQSHRIYDFGIPDRCATVTRVGLGLTGLFLIDHGLGSHSGFQASAAMIVKGDAAAKALGVDVVVLIGTDADACH